MKKVISIILSLVMLFSLLPTQTFAANQYTDTAGSWAEGAIDRWSEYGVIEGSDGKFDPVGTLTRAQMAAILSRLLALPEAKNAGFSDVKETDWYAPYINSCYASGIMLGSDGKAQPNDPITREQAIVMLSRALGIKPIENADLSGYTDAATVSNWAKGYVAAMAQAGIVKGTSDTTVSPKASIDRAATVTILDRAIGTYANVDGAEVEAADSGVILIAADNVKVTGAAKNATVIVSPSADGVTVNGAAVAAGTTTTAAEEKQEKPVVPGGGGGGGSPTPSYSDLTINEAKTVTGGTYKDVTITSAVGNGDVTLNNVTIKGKLIVQGGGENSIHLDGCKVDTIQVDKDTSAQDAQQPRIELNNTPVETIEAVKPVIIEADQKSTVKAVEAKSDVTVKGAATTVEKVTVPENAAGTGVELKIEGAKVAEVAAEKPVTINATNNASPIEKVEAKNDVTVTGEAAQIKQVEVPKNTVKEQPPVIDVQAGTVAEVKADKPAKVGGSGTVTNVTANAAVEVASETVVTVTVTVQVTVTVTGTSDVEVAVETTNAVSVVTTNTNVSISTTLTEDVNVVTKSTAEDTGTPVTHIHKWGSGSVTKAASCKEEGSVTYTCSGEGTCDKSNTKTESLPKLAHKEDIDPAVAATCTTDGKTAGKHCSECKEVLIAQQTVTKLGHAYGEATYTWAKDGDDHKCTATRVCANDTKHKETETVTATVVTKDATCTEKGETTYTATFAKEGFEKQTETEDIAALGHDYSVAQHDGAQHWMKCSRCDSTTEKTNHSYDEHNCEVSAKCKGCDYVKPAGQHSYGVYTQTKAPSCTEKGSEHAFCSVCRHEDVHEVAALGHTEAVDAAVEPTCTKTGLTEGKHCSVCDTVLVAQETVPALGHNWATEWSKDATQHWHECQREGCDATTTKENHDPGAAATEETAQTCTKCGYVIAPATGHICKNHLTKHDAVSATCTTAGNSAYWSCECGKFYSDAEGTTETDVAAQTLPPTGHSFATAWSHDDTNHWHAATCEHTTETKDLAAHTWDAGVVTTPAGVQDGEKTYTCTVCGATKKEVIHSNNTVVTDYAGFVGALDNNTVTGVTINADITVPAQDKWTVLNVAKPVVVAEGKTLTVAGYTTGGDKFGFLANDLTIVEGGSLTLKEGATLATTAIKSGNEGPFYNYTGRVCVAGGTLDVSKGTVAEGSFFNYDYYGDNCTDSDALILGDNEPEIEFSVTNEAQLRAAIADPKCTGGVIVENDITLESDLTVTKLVLVNNEKTLTVPEEKKLTVANGSKLQVSGTLFVYGTLDNAGEIFNLNLIDVFGSGTLSNSGVINGNGWPDENGKFSYISSLGIEGGATLTNTGTINDCIAVADYFGYGVNKEDKVCTVIGAFEVPSDNFEKIAVVFDTTQVQTLLNNNSYEIVMPCGTNATQDNTIDLGSITVPTGKTLLLKKSVFDGTNTYQNSFTCTDIDVEQSGVVVVQKDGSLTVTGDLTLATSSEEYWMNDSGVILVQNGGSLSIGGVQYTGEGGALTLDAETQLLLSGLPLDVANDVHRAGIFTILMGDAEVAAEKTFTVPEAWDNFILNFGATLTVNGTLTNSGHMENRDTLNVYGTLNNVGSIDNQNLIDVIGGTLSNSGVINGKWNEDWCDSYIAIEDGASIYSNFEGAEVNDRVTVADYWRNGEPEKKCTWDAAFDPASDNFDVMAVAFGTEQVKAALDAVSTWSDGTEQHSAPTYESVLPCGTMAWDGTDETVNTVELGDITVHEFGALMLKDEVFDGENTYKNSYKISEGKELTLEENSALVMRGAGELVINGNYVDKGAHIDYGDFNLSGKNAPVIVDDAEKLKTALANGGKIYLLPFAEDDENRVEDNWEGGTVYESQYLITDSGAKYTINRDTELIGLGTGNEMVAVFFDDGFTVAEDMTLKIDGLNIVAVKNSTVDGTVEVCNNAQLVVQGKDENATLTISNTGRIFVGEGESTALAIYDKNEVTSMIVNNGTIESFGKLIFDRNSQYSGSGEIKDASVVDVSSAQELMTALDNHIVSEIHIKGKWSITGTKDNEQDDEAVLRLESRNDKDLRVVIDSGAELTVPQLVRLEVSQRAELQIAEGGKLILNGGLNVFGSLKPDDWDKEENDKRIYVVQNDSGYINFFPDVMEFGKRLSERVGAYGLDAMTETEISDNQNRANEWPDLSKENEDRSGGFLFAVKYGLGPHTEKDDQGEDYIVWRPYDKITYGEAMTVLRGVYKAIDKDATELPASVALGEGDWMPKATDCISDNDVNDLLDKFVEALPPVEAEEYEFTVERKNCVPSDGVCDGGWHELVNGSHDNTIRNLHFTKAVTIRNSTTGLTENDTWGGKIRFEGCVFDCDINVTYNPTCDFRVEFDESCEFKNGAKVDVKQAQDADSKDLLANRNVTVYFGCTDGKVASSACVRAEAADGVSFLFNGVTVSGTNANNGGFGACMYFNCDAEHGDGFDWDENDHSNCSGDVCGEYQFTTDGDAAMTVSGTTAEKYPIRLSGIVDISGLTAQEDQEITLHNWSKCRDQDGNETGEHNTVVNINGHSVSINDSGDYVVSGTGTVTVNNQDENTRITVNGKELGSPHVFGNGGGIYLGLTDTDSVSFALEQGTWDEQNECVWTPIEHFKAVLHDDNGDGTYDKLQLERDAQNDWITEPNNVRLTVTVNGLSFVYDPLRNKVENDNENQ